MKRMVCLLLVLVILLCSCGQSDSTAGKENNAPTWQEQYDLGVRYLSEGNYQEAILAFTAAIEIDPKQAPAYVGRGDAYVKSGETEENLAAAKADYEKAIELDETNAEAYLGLADVYIRQGDYEKALGILRQGSDIIGNNHKISEKIAEIEAIIEKPEPWGYHDFNRFTLEQQQYVETLVGLVEQNERDSAWNLIKDIGILGEENTYTFAFHEYRIMIARIFSLQLCIGGSIEIHPKEGTGFYCCYSISESGDFYGGYGVGECKNWNWNGSFQRYAKYSGRLNYPDEYVSTDMVSGMMLNGLLNGDVEYYSKRTYVGENASLAGDSENTYTLHYVMGVDALSDGQELHSAFCSFSPNAEYLWD